MASIEVIRDVIQRIAEVFHPQEIVLFGFHAAGNALLQGLSEQYP